MISIEYHLGQIEQEYGPSIYLKGSSKDYFKLFIALHKLGKNNEIIIKSEDLIDIFSEQKYQIIFKSVENGNIALKRNNDKFYISLDKLIWRNFLYCLLSISFDCGHNYIDFQSLEVNEQDLVQVANIIISSEF